MMDPVWNIPHHEGLRSAAILAVVLGAVLALPEPARAQSPAPGDLPPELIAFSSFRDGGWDIWATPPRGGRPERLSESADDDKGPDLSPDGRQVVWGDNHGRIWVKDLTNLAEPPRELPVGAGLHSQPAWVADASKIIFSTRPDPSEEVAHLAFVEYPSDRPIPGHGVLFSRSGVAMFPSVSPDGRQVVFSYFEKPDDKDLRLPRRPLVEEIHILDISTGSVRQVTRFGANSTEPAFSPDGKHIAFSSNTEGHGYDLWVTGLGLEDGEPRRVTTDEGYEGAPCWSPDGKRLAFVSDRTGNLEIWIVPVEGGEWDQVTRTPDGGDSMEPSWRSTETVQGSPDSSPGQKKEPDAP